MEHEKRYYKTHEVKSRIALTMNPGVIHQLNKMAVSLKFRSRSELMEKIAGDWLQLQARKRLDEETVRYYRSLSAKEAKESAAWADLAARNAVNLWE